MPGRDLIVVGGSAGSLSPLITIIQGLPTSLTACVLIVIHGSSDSEGGLARILSRSGHLRVTMATDGHSIEPGVFVARPDHHLVVAPGVMRVTSGPKENGFRPAVDVLFRTASEAYGSRVIGVVLSGGLDDGSYGLGEIKRRHGLAIVQDPEDAEVASMPRNALQHVDVDYVLPAAAIALLLNRETALSGERDVAMAAIKNHDDPQDPFHKTDIARMEGELGPPSGLTCPDCGGALWQIQAGNPVRYQCHVGHAYSPGSLLERHDDHVEVALWTAVRALEERAELRKRMADQTAAAGLVLVSRAFAEQAEEAERDADHIRAVLERPGPARPAVEAVREMKAHRKGRRR